MRIGAGRHRGRRIAAPPGHTTRPTGARAREALFDVLAHGTPPLEGARFLDLFAGTGAIGLEAASRGAAAVLLVERERAAVETIRRNVEALGEAGRVRLLVGDAVRLGPAAQPFDIVFLDPPWRSGLAPAALHAVLEQGWLARGGRVIVELAADEALELPPGLVLERERRYGATRFAFLRPSGDAPAPPPGARRRRGVPAAGGPGSVTPCATGRGTASPCAGTAWTSSAC